MEVEKEVVKSTGFVTLYFWNVKLPSNHSIECKSFRFFCPLLYMFNYVSLELSKGIQVTRVWKIPLIIIILELWGQGCGTNKGKCFTDFFPRYCKADDKIKWFSSYMTWYVVLLGNTRYKNKSGLSALLNLAEIHLGMYYVFWWYGGHYCTILQAKYTTWNK